ncbi:MAG: glycoside hydrolase family 76 protein [Candidatus Omnitrophota bacterium]|nr:glycoside hydrolase family 76 protein [Candidatus Omnitrophota bacterium]
MQKLMLKDNAIDLAAKWIIDSGIQSSSGGFYAWYDLEVKKHSFFYSEITGYAITTLLFLHKIFNNNIFIEKAKKASSWIEQYALHPCGGLRTRLYDNDKSSDSMYSFTGENIFSFDTAMVLYGIASLFQLTGEKKYLDISLRIAKFLITKMQDRDGALFPIYNPKKDNYPEPKDKWSSQRAGFHTKASLGLLSLFEITKDKLYRDSAIKLCEYALSTQEPCGRFITDAINKTTHIHPHCYTIEGLLFAARALNNSKFFEAAEKAIQWTFKYVSSSGINELYEPHNNSFNNFQRSDIVAQVLRLGLIFSVSEKEKLEFLRSTLLSYQDNSKEPQQQGGFFYSKGQFHLNSWCAMFSLQALALYEDKNFIFRDKKLDLLI